MAIETLPEPSIPMTTPFRSGLGFLTATPIIAAATICLVLVIASAVLAPWLSPSPRPAPPFAFTLAGIAEPNRLRGQSVARPLPGLAWLKNSLTP